MELKPLEIFVLVWTALTIVGLVLLRFVIVPSMVPGPSNSKSKKKRIRVIVFQFLAAMIVFGSFFIWLLSNYLF